MACRAAGSPQHAPCHYLCLWYTDGTPLPHHPNGTPTPPQRHQTGTCTSEGNASGLVRMPNPSPTKLGPIRTNHDFDQIRTLQTLFLTLTLTSILLLVLVTSPDLNPTVCSFH